MSTAADRAPKQKARIVRWVRGIRRIVRAILVLGVLFVFLSHALVERAADGRVFILPQDVPSFRAALVLGTSHATRAGSTNPFFEARMDAAADLIRFGVVPGVVVSGDNSHASYNEPAQMQRALVARGVDGDRIQADFAGFRTLDSVVRMRDVFGEERFVIVSQRFHVERAIYVARARGIDAWGYAARDASGYGNLSVQVREYFARVRAVLDVHLLGTEPRFLGDPIAIEFPPALDVESAP